MSDGIAVGRCPCCGQPIRDLPLTWHKSTRLVVHGDRVARLNPMQAVIFDILWRSRPLPLDFEAVLERAYAGTNRYSITNLRNALSVRFFELRRKLGPLGITIDRKPRMYILDLAYPESVVTDLTRG